MKEQSAKEQFDAAYEELKQAKLDHQSILDKQTDYTQRISAARQILVEKTKALRALSSSVTRELSGDMRGRPLGKKRTEEAPTTTAAAPKKRGRPKK